MNTGFHHLYSFQEFRLKHLASYAGHCDINIYGTTLASYLALASLIYLFLLSLLKNNTIVVTINTTGCIQIDTARINEIGHNF